MIVVKMIIHIDMNLMINAMKNAQKIQLYQNLNAQKFL